MDRIELIAKCRYYSGEEKCPYNNEQLIIFWQLERAYVMSRGELVSESDGYYKRLDGKEYAGIPRALLITIFSHWVKGTYEPKRYMSDFYNLIDDYLEIASEGFPKDQVPKNRKR